MIKWHCSKQNDTVIVYLSLNVDEGVQGWNLIAG